MLYISIPLALYGLYTILCKFIPFNDKGHCCFSVPNERAAIALAKVLKESGNKPNFIFSIDGVNQMVFRDNRTVLVWIDDSAEVAELDTKFSGTAISLVASNPTEAVSIARKILEDAGFSCTLRPDLMKGTGDKLIVLQTNAFKDTLIVFRKTALSMGKIPNKRLVRL